MKATAINTTTTVNTTTTTIVDDEPDRSPYRTHSSGGVRRQGGWARGGFKNAPQEAFLDVAEEVVTQEARQHRPLRDTHRLQPIRTPAGGNNVGRASARGGSEGDVKRAQPVDYTVGRLRCYTHGTHRTDGKSTIYSCSKAAAERVAVPKRVICSDLI